MAVRWRQRCRGYGLAAAAVSILMLLATHGGHGGDRDETRDRHGGRAAGWSWDPAATAGLGTGWSALSEVNGSGRARVRSWRLPRPELGSRCLVIGSPAFYPVRVPRSPGPAGGGGGGGGGGAGATGAVEMLIGCMLIPEKGNDVHLLLSPASRKSPGLGSDHDGMSVSQALWRAWVAQEPGA